MSNKDVVVYDTDTLRKLRDFTFDPDKPFRESVNTFLEVLGAARDVAGWTGTLSFGVMCGVVLKVSHYGWMLKKPGVLLDRGEWAPTLADPESFVSALEAWCSP
jgi:hypothetical protein